MKSKNVNPVDWNKIELLCLRSFTGGYLSPDEQSQLQYAYKHYPKEYSERTNAIRESERSRIKSM